MKIISFFHYFNLSLDLKSSFRYFLSYNGYNYNIIIYSTLNGFFFIIFNIFKYKCIYKVSIINKLIVKKILIIFFDLIPQKCYKYLLIFLWTLKLYIELNDSTDTLKYKFKNKHSFETFTVNCNNMCVKNVLNCCALFFINDSKLCL